MTEEVDASPMSELVITVIDPRAEPVALLVERHVAFARTQTPPENIHAVGTEALLDPRITVFAASRAGTVLGIGALKELDAQHGELKSMHTAAESRGQGVGGALLEKLLQEARNRGYRRVSLDTGTTDAFFPARQLYLNTGFEICEPYGDYVVTEDNVYMTLELQ